MAEGKEFSLNLLIDHPDTGVDKLSSGSDSVTSTSASKKWIWWIHGWIWLLMAPQVRPQPDMSVMSVQRSQSGLDAQRNQGYHCQWAGRRCVCACVLVHCANGGDGGCCLEGKGWNRLMDWRGECTFQMSPCHAILYTSRRNRVKIKETKVIWIKWLICSICWAHEEIIPLHQPHIRKRIMYSAYTLAGRKHHFLQQCMANTFIGLLQVKC